jgi:hypothetical protein
MMDVRLHDRGIDARFVAIFPSQINSRLHDQLMEGFQPSQAVKGAVVRAPRDKASSCRASASARAEPIAGSQPAATCPGVFQAPLLLASHCLIDLFVIVKKIRNGLQKPFQKGSLLHQLPIAKTAPFQADHMRT